MTPARLREIEALAEPTAVTRTGAFGLVATLRAAIRDLLAERREREKLLRDAARLLNSPFREISAARHRRQREMAALILAKLQEPPDAS